MKKNKLSILYMEKIVGIIAGSENPLWPPKMGSIIAIQKVPSDKIYIGRAIIRLQSENAIVVTLLNDTEYIDSFIAETSLVSGIGKKGHMVVLPTYGWRYVDPTKLSAVMAGVDMIEDVAPKKCDKNDIGDDGIHDTSLLTERKELQMETLFKEKDNEKVFIIEDFNPLPDGVQKAVLAKLRMTDEINPKDIKIVVNKSIAVNNLIGDISDEKNEGDKIMKWIIDNMMTVSSDEYNIFGDLKMAVFNGYVHIARRGIPVVDTITPELVPGLVAFNWQYGKQIDYDTLKYVMFQTEGQSKLEKDNIAMREAEKILSQEYLIALQPQPKFQAWALKRLLMCWYADVDLQNNIRKIKVLINQWRGKTDKKFNQKYGVQPSLVIYPRYGKKSSKIVLTKLSDFFVLYSNIAWSCSKPTFFSKVTDLIWYTNGNLDLKIYFKIIKDKERKHIKNRMFSDNYDKIKIGDDLIYPK